VPAQVIFLNGSSSAGKTTLAKHLQKALPGCWQHMALDHFRDGLPDKYRGLNAPEHTLGAQGLNVVPVTDGPTPFTKVVFGDAGNALLRGMRRAMRAMVDANVKIIIDDVLLEPEFLQDYLTVFSGVNVLFVGVRCDLASIDAREQQRAGRFPGTAYGHFKSCHAHALYDAEVDTGALSPSDCSKVVEQALKADHNTAFDTLRSMASPGL
jgi:chloramphenicol 3-O phosphotransferase|tara:strand:- start:118 stop:747 length:630 start_codon:yes stop_codon:yes gene_type:complete